MNNLEYYNRQKESWNDNEIENIRTEYQTNEMTIRQIGDIHRRTPGSISYKLKSIGLITNNTLSRGYLEYKNSNLYKEIVKTGGKNDKEKKIKKETEINSKIDNVSINLLFREIIEIKAKLDNVLLNPIFREVIELRHEVKDLKKDIKEITGFITRHL